VPETVDIVIQILQNTVTTFFGPMQSLMETFGHFVQRLIRLVLRLFDLALLLGRRPAEYAAQQETTQQQESLHLLIITSGVLKPNGEGDLRTFENDV
jgi:hypothetical protein